VTTPSSPPPPQGLPPLRDPASVAVVVPARDAGDTVAAALRTATSQQPPVAEVVVACAPEDASTRAAVAPLAAQDPRVRVVDAPGGTTPVALNAGIAATTADVVVRLDAHAELPDGYVARAVATLRTTGAGNVGGRQVPVGGTGFAGAVAAAMASPVGAGGAAYRTGSTAGPVDTVYLGVFRREALEAVGGYHPDMVRNQDAELNLRLTAAGYTVWFDPDLAVAYRPRDTVGGLARQYLGYGRWRRVTARLHRSSLQPRQLAAPVLVAGLTLLVLQALVTGWWVLPIGATAGYLGALVVAGAQAAPTPRLALSTAVALGTMHLAWGVGFLSGPPRDAPRPTRTTDDR
jgi:succinoglycan biosynthesis protein ExoA